MASPYVQNLLLIIPVTIALIYWIRSLRRTDVAGVRAMVKALAALDLALISGTLPAVSVTILGTRFIPILLVHTSCLAAAYWLQVFVLYLAQPPDAVPARANRRLYLLLVSLALLVTFYVADFTHSANPGLAAEEARTPFTSLYLTVFVVYLGIAMFSVFYIGGKARDLPRGYLRTGLNLLRFGGLLGGLFVVNKTLFTVAAHAGIAIPWNEFGLLGVGTLLMIVSILLLMAGVTLPAVGPRLQQRRQYRALHELWQDLTEFAPAVKFATLASADVGPLDITDRLRNRITEIRDVLAGPLQPYLDPAVRERASNLARERDLSPETTRAVAEAAVVAAALSAAAVDQPVLAEEPVVFAGPATTDYRDEAAWLAPMGLAYATSPIVILIRQEASSATDSV